MTVEIPLGAKYRKALPAKKVGRKTGGDSGVPARTGQVAVGERRRPKRGAKRYQ